MAIRGGRRKQKGWINFGYRGLNLVDRAREGNLGVGKHAETRDRSHHGSRGALFLLTYLRVAA
jgi:hypothetical protein